MPSDLPLVPPRMRAYDLTTSSSQNSLMSTPSSFQITAALEDSDIEHSATISQRRHMSDSVLATDLKMKSSSCGECMIYSSELGRMISLPQGKCPPLRSSSSISITSHSTKGMLRGMRFSKEPFEPGSTATGSASPITPSLLKGSQEQLQNVVVVGDGGVVVKKVSSRMLNKIYHIMPKAEAARTVQTIAPAPQIRPPELPGLVKSRATAQEMVASVSVLASSVSSGMTPLTPPSSSPSGTRSFTATSRQSKDEEGKIKVLFFGSDSFSVPHLEALIQEKTPLTVLAKAHNLKTFPSPDRKGGFDAWTFPQDPAVPAWDFGVVVSFGWFLPDDVITRFTRAGINVHPSLLPKYRGSAPLQRAILNDDATTGVTVQLLDPNEFDAGKILAQAEVAMPENATYRSLEALLAKKGGELVVDVVNNFDERKRDAKTQDPDKVTKANKISREACKMQWGTWKASRAERLHRANGFRYPITSSWSIPVSDKVLSISLFDLFLVPNVADTPSSTGTPKQSRGGYAVEDGDAPTQRSAPGTIFYHRPSESLHVSCADGSLLGVKALQFEGKKRVSAKDFFNGYHVKSGISRFE
ncbi:hypothetical protein BG006_008675 [Podila minutissima]|uniref:methionyl-tRNA formyltransferase n=1 Tax=Podila minutissima TaxID=64525 RepID=A0A9P5SFK9_9FUNG|nr:hypothetical protein BG006_008675 [Podila minutissima]